MKIDGNLSLILPAYNEAGNLDRVVRHSIGVLDTHLLDWKMIIVNDGSTDETGRVAETLADQDARIRVVHHLRNRGYGTAWRTGFAHGQGTYLMCMDADGQFDLGDIALLLPYVNHYDVVAGYRIARQDPPHRKLNAWLFRLASRLLFGIQLRDFDCGFKIFRTELVRSLPVRSPGALINLEIFSYARLRKAKIREVGVHHYPREVGTATGARPSVVIQAMLELGLLRLRIWWETTRRWGGLRRLSTRRARATAATARAQAAVEVAASYELDTRDLAG